MATPRPGSAWTHDTDGAHLLRAYYNDVCRPSRTEEGSQLSRPKGSATDRLKDLSHLATRVVLSAVPVVGGPATEIFSAIINPPLEKRRNEWIESVVDGLHQLEQRVNTLDVKALSDDRRFVTTLLHASRLAVQNHQHKKVQALRNAVLQSAICPNLRSSEELLFLTLVDRLTALHLQLLGFFASYDAYLESHHETVRRCGSLSDAICTLENERLSTRRHLLGDDAHAVYARKAIRDLMLEGLLELWTEETHYQGGVQPRMLDATGQLPLPEYLEELEGEMKPTELGRSFLRFISAPEAVEPSS